MPTRPHSKESIETWRNLRLSMVAVVVGLFTAVVYEHFQVSGKKCFQTSISAYYYTPARGVLVAALVSIGVAMVCLRGNTPGEDRLLNMGAVLAPIVALVPTLGPGTCRSVESAKETHDAKIASVANNVTALLIAGGLVLAFALWRAARRERPTPLGWAAFAVAVAVWLAVLVIHSSEPDYFAANAHGAAANAMFLCIIAVACINVREYRSHNEGATWLNRYTPIAAAMLLVLGAHLGALILHKTAEWKLWSYETILVEFLLLLFFAAFWVIQTCELWSQGLRPEANSG